MAQSQSPSCGPGREELDRVERVLVAAREGREELAQRAAEMGGEKRAGRCAGFPPFTESSGGSAQKGTCGV
jgi:hypothetical protein